MNNPSEFVDGICKDKVICAQKTNTVLEAGNWLVKEPNQFMLAAKEKGLNCDVASISDFLFDQERAERQCKMYSGLDEETIGTECVQKEEMAYNEILGFIASMEDKQLSGFMIKSDVQSIILGRMKGLERRRVGFNSM